MKQVDGSKKPASRLARTAQRSSQSRPHLIHDALTALLLLFALSLATATGGSPSQPSQPPTHNQEIVLDGIHYSPLTNEEGRTIYVPTIATPENVIKTIEENLDRIQDEVNWDFKRIYEVEPIEELTLEPNLEQKLTTYLFLAADNEGNAAPKTVEELKRLEEKLSYPIIMTYGNFKTETKEGITYLVPIKIKEPDGYLATLKLDTPEERLYCDAEASFTIRITQEGAKETDMRTQEKKLIYDKSTADWIGEYRMDAFTPLPYDLFKPTKPTKEETWIHLCVKKDPRYPIKATTYFSAPFAREYIQWAHPRK